MAVGLAAVLVISLQSLAHAAPGDQSVLPSGLVILGAEPKPADELPEAAAQRLHEATELAEANPDDLAYPWYDPKDGAVVLDTVGATGASLASTFISTGVSQGKSLSRSRNATFSMSRLEGIKNDTIEISAATVPDGDAIFMTGPDAVNNRIIIYVSRTSDALFEVLAAKYGTAAIAIQHIPGSAADGDGRDNDTSPFYGGAKTVSPKGCTSGFSWRNGTAHMMLTAGHCAPSGGDLSTPSARIGYITPSSRENWNVGKGTVYLTGSSTYRGDLALSNVDSGKATSAVIYRGGPGSYSSAYVAEMWSRSPVAGDKYCVGGRVTGEKCGWTVYAKGYNFKWSTGEIARNMVRSYYRNDGVCTIGGDSGGPVYTVRSDGRVAAKGIHHGKATNSVTGCMNVFTDIWQAYYGLPGTLATG
ncbi:S1 family peptidase [Micromonospora sp. PLK6-60]|uniref:S1 family peptidase n=1 Tax=Micromonospora sp. PLK6-60 TaxID=2873383 RepID=UPI001CA793EB|nr:S1 family peptidase [Micromonospora sp. PLK6-60]MBY8872020.1 S1 family peptidase [Micromonospora sp. PLK6-60]